MFFLFCGSSLTLYLMWNNSYLNCSMRTITGTPRVAKASNLVKHAEGKQTQTTLSDPVEPTSPLFHNTTEKQPINRWFRWTTCSTRRTSEDIQRALQTSLRGLPRMSQRDITYIGHVKSRKEMWSESEHSFNACRNHTEFGLKSMTMWPKEAELSWTKSDNSFELGNKIHFCLEPPSGQMEDWWDVSMFSFPNIVLSHFLSATPPISW